MTLWSSCAPKHVLWQLVFRSVSEFEVRNLIQWTGHFAIYVRWLFGWRYISSLHSADELQQERNSCPLLRSCFIGSCHVGVSKRFSVVSALQSFAFLGMNHLQRAQLKKKKEKKKHVASSFPTHWSVRECFVLGTGWFPFFAIRAVGFLGSLRCRTKHKMLKGVSFLISLLFKQFVR